MSKIFLDTNILVYSMDKHDKKKQSFARNLLKNADRKYTFVISTQVIQETYVILTSKLNMDKVIAKNIVHDLGNLEVIQIDLGLIEQAVDISLLSQISFWDALIVSTAESANCSSVLSEDLNDGQIIRGIRIINPFKNPEF